LNINGHRVHHGASDAGNSELAVVHCRAAAPTCASTWAADSDIIRHLVIARAAYTLGALRIRDARNSELAVVHRGATAPTCAHAGTSRNGTEIEIKVAVVEVIVVVFHVCDETIVTELVLLGDERFCGGGQG
jgi:hypothetical protein